jgi:hypothetical protein
MGRSLAIALLVAHVLTACGGEEDEPPPRTNRPPPVAPAPTAPGTPGGGKQLQPMRTIEDRVTCPSPTPAKTCDPKLSTSCDVEDGQPKQYCLETTKGWFCGVCPERSRIRQVLKPRDFATEVTRDPFMSVVVQPPGQVPEGQQALKKDVVVKCDDAKKVKLAQYSFTDLKLVGVIKIGIDRKLLVMDPVNRGHVIGKEECVGKERAWVKNIGEEPGSPRQGILGRGLFVTFEIPPDATQSDTRPAEEKTIFLNPNVSNPTSAPPTDTAPSRPSDTPVVAPGATPPRTDNPPSRGDAVEPPPVVSPPK